MGNKKFWILFVLVLFFVSCITTGEKSTTSTKAPAAASAKAGGAKVKTVALVSLIVRNHGTYGSMGTIPPELINANMGKVLSITENTLGNYWKVKPVASFVTNKNYQKLTKGPAPTNYFTAKVNGKPMPVFFRSGNDYIKGNINKETAQMLCSMLAVDAIALVYSEWSIDTGKFVPTNKALTKNCVAMYDKNGKYLFFNRKDVRGSNAIGSAWSGAHTDEKTIGQWLEAYGTGVTTVFGKESKKL